MRFVTVARRPLSGSVAATVLQHGAGALNIDATRIGTSDSLNGGAYSAGAGERHDGAENWRYKRGENGGLAGQEFQQPQGRWPANLILSHTAECAHLGSKQVESTSGVVADHHRRNVPMGENGIYGKGDMRGTKPTCYVSEDGTEVVESWECVSGCPVANLDAQGGRGNARAIFGSKMSPNPNALDQGDGDVGGASRFFKQVGGSVSTQDGVVSSDLIDYLYTMITPTHVGGESLVALDIDAVNWSSIEDGKYHGIIARGEPTAEQIEHMWRVIKPGAHVLLIAPDSCPTGHHGACALEDRGFEIRDAILLVTEPGRLHYVPKANSSERNYGCEALAAKRKGPPIYELTEEALEDEEQIEALQEALTAAGVDEEVINALVENGLPKDQIPKGFKHLFTKKEGSGKYGNNHPTVKPKEVMARLMADVPEGLTVLDPFMGSGSTGLACLDTHHNFVGIEREPEYIEIADTRIRAWNARDLKDDVLVIDSEAPPPTPVEIDVGGGLFDLFGD